MKIAEHNSGRLEQQAAIYKAVAHPVRLAILHHFSTCECDKLTVKSIYESLGIGQPIASHHLGILKRSGVVRRTLNTGTIYYDVCDDNECVRSILNALNF